jgi:hypothetical protein
MCMPTRSGTQHLRTNDATATAAAFTQEVYIIDSLLLHHQINCNRRTNSYLRTMTWRTKFIYLHHYPPLHKQLKWQWIPHHPHTVSHPRTTVEIGAKDKIFISNSQTPRYAITNLYTGQLIGCAIGTDIFFITPTYLWVQFTTVHGPLLPHHVH